MSMNLSKKPSRISLPSPLSASTVEAFVLESGEEGLESRCVSIQPFISQLAGNLLCVVWQITIYYMSLNVKPFAIEL